MRIPRRGVAAQTAVRAAAGPATVRTLPAGKDGDGLANSALIMRAR